MLSGDPIFDQHTSECRTGELAALIRVEDLGLAIAGESVLKRLDAECRLHRDRYAPRQHATADRTASSAPSGELYAGMLWRAILCVDFVKN